MGKKRGKSKREDRKAKADDRAAVRTERYRAIFQRSVPINSTTSQAEFSIPELGLDVESELPSDETKHLKSGSEYVVSLRQVIKDVTLRIIDSSLKPAWEFVPELSSPFIQIDKRLAIQGAIFQRMLKSKEVPVVGGFRILGSGLNLAIPLRDGVESELKKGDACQLLCSRAIVEPSEREGRLIPTLGNYMLDLEAMFLHKIRFESTLAPRRLSQDAPSLPKPTLPDREDQRPTEPESIPTATEIIDDIRAVQTPIIRKLNAWLASFEGKTYAPENAPGVVAKIRYIVASAGCELLVDNQPISLTFSASERSKKATIRAFSAGKGQSRRVYSRSAFPKLTARPASPPEES